MADRWKRDVRVRHSYCENLLECVAYRIKDKPGKVLILAGLCPYMGGQRGIFYSIILPSILMVTTCQGMNFPLF